MAKTKDESLIPELLLYKKIFEKFIDKQVLNDQLKNSLTTDGEIKNVCVMFTDVRGFTKFSEKAALQATNSFLNNFYDIVIHHTQNGGGIMNKFLGDGTMSIFGVFDDGYKYVESCIGVARSIMKDFKTMTSQKDEPALFLGIGINFGTAIVGTFGNGDFVDFTAIGHTVNIASRVQSTASNNQILVTREVTEHLNAKDYQTQGFFHLKNVTKPVELFEIVQAY